jgi:predicted metal-dependent phosphoesterase TrpH
MERKKYIDFHMHTEFSDGVSSPEHVVRAAALQDLDIIAITDHDKTDGYERARVEGNKWGLVIIPGVEISTDKYHILGIGINPKNEEFRKFLEYSASEQRRVCAARSEAFRQMGVPISLEKVEATFPYSRLGKQNLLMTMMQDEDCRKFFETRGEKLTDEVYKRYNKTYDINDKLTSISCRDAIKSIQCAGGLAFIAHPFKDMKSVSEMDELLALGIDGLEIQPTFNGRNEAFKDYAKQNNLLVTYGSDWHAGLFGREMLNGKGEGINVLYPRLAEALRIN